MVFPVAKNAASVEPLTKNPKPQNRNPNPEIRNPEFETRHPKSEAKIGGLSGLVK